jgi:uncharacterized protein (DUF302 family)
MVHVTRKLGSRTPAIAAGASAVGASASGAFALGAFALGAVAIGALAIRRLAIRTAMLGDARIRSLEIDDLAVRRLRTPIDAHAGAIEPAGVLDTPSAHGFDDTVERLAAILRERKLTLFAVIDHAAEAKRAGMELRPTKLLVFGRPEAGTPLMRSRPRSALDLPLKALVWQDETGRVWISTNSAEHLGTRHAVSNEDSKIFATAEAIAKQAAV